LTIDSELAVFGGNRPAHRVPGGRSGGGDSDVVIIMATARVEEIDRLLAAS
jgi:hypothetical protein